MNLKIDKNKVIVFLIFIFIVFGVIILWAVFQKGDFPREETTEELLDRLTPDDAEPLTQEERAAVVELLMELTPDNPKPMTEEEKEELKDLLDRLTPKD